MQAIVKDRFVLILPNPMGDEVRLVLHNLVEQHGIAEDVDQCVRHDAPEASTGSLMSNHPELVQTG
jgi:hypothetical protein